MAVSDDITNNTTNIKKILLLLLKKYYIKSYTGEVAGCRQWVV